MSWNVLTVGARRVLAFRYVDRQAGPSAKGAYLADVQPTPEEAQEAATRPAVTVRLAPAFTLVPLSDAEVQRLGLPARPQWAQLLEQPGPWGADPRLAGKLHASYPDDLQAAFFLPEQRTVEQLWVRLAQVVPEHDAYRGRLLNTAHGAPSLCAGTEVVVRPTPGSAMPVWLSPAVLGNLRDWRGKCSACGFDLVVEPVEALIKREFRSAPPGTVFEALTTRCAMCRGTQLLTRQPRSNESP
ncbi:MAG: hypothetical protein IT380_21125 [Myxococcales bacterium]|nr:hypothetical protein [Myxococcales bacterium]